MGKTWIIHLKWQLGREEWRILDFDDGTTNMMDVLRRLHLDFEGGGVLPIYVEITGPVKE